MDDMISSIIIRLIGITLCTIIINVLCHGIHSGGFSNTYYIISMIIYSIWIIMAIESHIDTEVIKEVQKIVKRYETLRDMSYDE